MPPDTARLALHGLKHYLFCILLVPYTAEWTRPTAMTAQQAMQAWSMGRVLLAVRGYHMSSVLMYSRGRARVLQFLLQKL